MPRRPISTYRLQLTPAFRFEDAPGWCPISPRSASPTSTSRRLRRARRDRRTATTSSITTGCARSSAAKRATRTLCDGARRGGMGQLVDFVPNHMGIGPRTAGGWTCWRTGRARITRPTSTSTGSRSRTSYEARCCVPCSAISTARCWSAASCGWRCEGGAFFVDYYEHRFPSRRARSRAPRHRLDALRGPSSAPATCTCRSSRASHGAREAGAARRDRPRSKVAERAREKEVAKRRLGALPRGEPARSRARIDENVRSLTARRAIRAASICSTSCSISGLSARPTGGSRRRDQLPALLRHQSVVCSKRATGSTSSSRKSSKATRR